MKLSQLPIGATAEIVAIHLPEPQQRKLEALGIRPGVLIMTERRAPLRDPCEYVINGNLIAIRRVISQAIEIRYRR